MAEAEVEVEVEVEENVDVEDKTLHAATDTTSATHPILDIQGSHKPYPVNILLDTGSLPDGKWLIPWMYIQNDQNTFYL